MMLLSIISFISKAQEIDVQNMDLSKMKGQLKEGIKKYKEATLFEVSGGLSLNTVLTLQSMENSQPFSFVASGNVMVSIKGYKLPFTFTYSNWKFSNTNPAFRFNRFTFKPRLKNNLGLILGDGSMSFSPYTLNGFQFYGLGGEKTFGKLKIQAMGGRFLDAVSEDSTGRTPAYKRMGAGIKAAYVNDNKKIGFSLFYAQDDKNSIPTPENINFERIRPMENMALSIEAAYPLAKQLTWEGELATSILTENTNFIENTTLNPQNTEGGNPLKKLLKHNNATTKVFTAMKSNINYIIGQEGLIGLGFERVAPDYRTLGAYYFTNDFQNITVNAQHKGKVNMGLSTGIQYDNLNDAKGSNSGRMVISSNASFKAQEQTDLTMTYSNFQSFTFIRTGFERINQVNLFQNIDTLNFTLLTQNAALNVNHNFKKDSTNIQMLSLNLNYMESQNNRSGLTLNTPQLNNGSQFFNTALTYSLAKPNQNLTVAGGFNLSYNYGGISNTITAGPIVAVSKNLYDKTLPVTGTLAYNMSKTANIKQHTVTMTIGANTVFREKHNFSANVLAQNQSGNQGNSSFTFTLSAGYNYSFGYKHKKKTTKKEGEPSEAPTVENQK
jgi:hypothetical protein